MPADELPIINSEFFSRVRKYSNLIEGKIFTQLDLIFLYASIIVKSYINNN